MIGIEQCTGTIIGADMGEFGNLWEDGYTARLDLGTPNVSVSAIARLEKHSRAARTAAFKIHFASIANVNETSKLASRSVGRSGLCGAFYRRYVLENTFAAYI